jgi:serine protease Do
MRLHPFWMFGLATVFVVLGELARSPAQEAASRATHVIPDRRERDVPPLKLTSARRSPIVAVVQRVKDSVVNIQSERTIRSPGSNEFHMFSPSNGRVNGMGTGIIIDARGYIITNHHVIEDVNVIRVRLCDGTAQSAQVVARNPEMDLAILKIDTGRPLPVIPLGTAADLMVGETVVAVGNAYGYEHTVSVGIVSAVKRDVSLNKEMSYKALIQTDASINPGNSGGPLLNIHGDLIGVNVAIRAGAQGIGFAIPVDAVIRVAADMMRQRRKNSSYDGLLYHDRLEPGEDGLVRHVVVDYAELGSPAAQAGVKKGDVLVQIGEVRVQCSFDVEFGLLNRQAGDAVPLVVRRGDKEKRIEVALSTPNRNRPHLAELIWAKLGLRLKPLAAESVAEANAQLHGGLEVTAIDHDGLAARAGIRRGDILVGLHQYETVNLDNVAYVLGHPDLASFNPMYFFIVRNGQVRKGRITNLN